MEHFSHGGKRHFFTSRILNFLGKKFKLLFFFSFIECISLIGLAVGPEKFTADAAEVMEMLLKTQTGDNEMADDDPQMSYMISAWARICKILGSGFAPYLPLVMGPIMKTASMKPEVALLDNDELTGIDNDADDWQFVSLGIYLTFFSKIFQVNKKKICLNFRSEIQVLHTKFD